MINSSGFLHNGGNKFHLMLILPDEFNKGPIFDLTVFQKIINISSPNSCSNIFSSLEFWKVNVAHPVVFSNGTFTIPTWENFELSQWPSINYFMYLVGLHRIKKILQLPRLIYQNKVNLVYVVQIFWNPEIVNWRSLLWRPLV